MLSVRVDFAACSFWNKCKAAWRLMRGQCVCTLVITNEGISTGPNGDIPILKDSTDKIVVTDTFKN